MKWEELDNDIKTFEKDCLSLLRDIETKELTSQEKHGDIEKENTNLLKEIEEVNNENSVLKLELSGILSLNENLKKTFEDLQEKVNKSEFLCVNLRSGMEVCENDSVRMKKANEMLQIGKEFTRVRWDYSTPLNICKGYFSNKDKKTLESFELDRDTMSEDEIQKYLWEHIEANSGAVWTDLVSLCDSDVIENKENVFKN